MMKVAVAIVFLILVLVIAAICGANYVMDNFLVHVEQPIAFSHNIHMEEAGLECLDCHQYFETQKNSGRPTLEICLECHEDDESETPEMKKLMEYAEKELEIPWNRIYYLPDHVYFSHQMHTQKAEIKCETCHGEMAKQTSPPSKPLVLHTMDFCMDCHKETQASRDCLACHK